MRRPLAMAVALALLGGCTPPSRVPAGGREALVRSLAGQRRYLRASAYVCPFYADPGRVLLTDRLPAEIEVVPVGGAPALAPPVPLRVLPPGTPVFVDRLQFPTGVSGWDRPEGTPRGNPWLLVTVEGVDRPAVVVLAPGEGRPEDLLAGVDRLLADVDPTVPYAALPEPVRDAIRARAPYEGMHRDEVAMAWGRADRVVTDRVARTEEWTWSGGKRRAVFQDDRLVRLEPGSPAAKTRPAGNGS